MIFRLKQKFNLIEVAIAIGIMAIGITALLALFPIGFERSRDAIGENYCADAADSLFAYIARKANSSHPGCGWEIVAGLPVSKVSIKADSIQGNGFDFGDEADSEGDIYYDVSDKNTDNDDVGADSGVYGIKVKTGNVVDFTGEALMWKTPLPAVQISEDTPIYIPETKAVGLNIEISWLVERPYAKRKKNYYYFELHNQND